jgi:hypothetical protein
MPLQALFSSSASGDAAEKPKRARTSKLKASKPKVKTGCNNCK